MEQKRLYSKKKTVASIAILAGISGCLWVSTAHADVPFSLLFAAGKFAYWWVMVVGLAIEATILHKFFELNWKRSAAAALTLNVASTLLGLLGGPFIFIPVFPLEPAGTTAAIIIIIAYTAVIDNLVELSALRLLFRTKLSLRRFLIFLLANAITGALVFTAFLTMPSESRLPKEEAQKIERLYSKELTAIENVIDDLPQVCADEKYARQWVSQKRKELESYAFYRLTVSCGRHGWGVIAYVPELGYRGSGYTGKSYVMGEFRIGRGELRTTTGNIPIYICQLNPTIGEYSYHIYAELRIR